MSANGTTPNPSHNLYNVFLFLTIIGQSTAFNIIQLNIKIGNGYGEYVKIQQPD